MRDISTAVMPNGIALTLRQPAGTGPFPVIILCHGFCGIRGILLPDFAEAFVRAGFATLTFDYRGFGDSEGERGRLVPARQIDDIVSVIDWAKQHPALDADRIGLWGTSFGGCHVFGAAVNNPDVKCIVSQLAFADGAEIVTGSLEAAEKAAFIATLEKMDQKRQSSGKEMFVAITRVLNDEESKTFFEENRQQHPKMDIKIPFLTVRETLLYRPADNAAKVSCPTLVVVAGRDSVNPPQQGRALFDAVGAGDKSFYTVNEARHYDIYTGHHFEQVVRVQTQWFADHL